MSSISHDIFLLLSESVSKIGRYIGINYWC